MKMLLIAASALLVIACDAPDQPAREPAVPTTRALATGSGNVVATSGNHGCATRDGALWCWGQGLEGQLGDGLAVNRSRPGPVMGLGEDVTGVAAGRDYTCAVQRGALYCWGANGSGQLGDGTSEKRLRPTLVTGMVSSVEDVEARGVHVCAVQNGQVYCWGAGQPVPRRVPDIVGATHVAMSTYQACATSDAGVMCWKLGERKPSTLPGLEDVDDLGFASLERLCALRKGELLCGTLEHPLLPDRKGWASAPEPVLGGGVTSFGTHSYGFCAVRSGEALCTETIGADAVWSTPKPWDGLSIDSISRGCASTGTTVECEDPMDFLRAVHPIHGFDSGVTAISGDEDDICLLQDGGVYCFETSRNGADRRYVAIEGLERGVTGISGTHRAGCAVQDDELRCWGRNDYGQRGIGIVGDTPPLTTVPGMRGVESVSHSGLRVCALKDGEVSCWGHPYEAMDGACEDEACPTPGLVPGLERDVTALRGAGTHACAVLNDQLFCWGEVPGAPADRDPGLVPFETDKRSLQVRSFDVAYGRTCAAFDGGFPRPGQPRVVCRGNASSYADRYDVAFDLSFTTSTPQIRAGRYNTCLPGATRCWGLNHKSQLGASSDAVRIAEPDAALDLPLLHTEALYVGSSIVCGAVGGELRCAGDRESFMSSAQSQRTVTFELPAGRTDSCTDC